MKIRKLLAVVLAVAMLVTTMSVGFTASAADSTFSAAADKTFYVIGDTISVDVTAPASVAKVYLANEVGTGLASNRTFVVNADGSKTWTLSFTLGTLGMRTLELFADGVDTGVSVSFEIVEPYDAPETEPKFISASVSETGNVNANFAVTVVTNSAVENVALFNENGNGLISQKTVFEDNGVKTWLLLTSVGTAGPRNFTIKYADGSKQWITAQEAAVSVNTYEPEAVQKLSSLKRSSVHDPSIFKGEDGVYYLVGTGPAMAKSTDLINWSGSGNASFGTLATELATPLEWAAYDNSTNAGRGYALWASGIVYNPKFANADGTFGAYMITFPLSANFRRGCVSIAVSKSPTGPFTYVDTPIYSGFNINGGKDEPQVTKTIEYQRTNIDELIAKGTLKAAAGDTIPGFKDEWVIDNGNTYNAGLYPQAIDPELFFDKDGKLWLIYGSHAGGIWLLEVDPATGMAKYPGVDGVTEGGDQIDRYFGIRVASGYSMSGEGPLIKYDKTTGYYYLFVTYGQISEGYHIREFRSQNVTGPYVDAAGRHAAVNTYAATIEDYGIKLMGNYQFSNTQGYKHGGHNGIYIDEETGEVYNSYHQMFTSGGSYQDRVHQMFRTANGWLTMAVYENRGDKISETGYSEDEILGWYEIVNHGSLTTSAMLDTLYIKLNADGTITGDYDGTWTKTDGTYYMSVTINGVVYSGVFFKQTDESGYDRKVMTFSAIGTNNESLWAARMNINDDGAIGATQALSKIVLPSSTNMDIALLTKGEFGSDITWFSNKPEALAPNGKITRGAADQRVTLTALAEFNGFAATKTFTVTVKAATTENEVPAAQALYNYGMTIRDGFMTLNTGALKGNAVLEGSADVVIDSAKGLSLKTTIGAGSTGALKLPSDVFMGMSEGFSVSMWAKAASSDAYTITINNPAGGHLTPSVSLTPNTWTFVTITVGKDGIKTYKDGALSGTVAMDLTSFLKAVETTPSSVKVGDMNSIMIDDIAIYGVILTAEQVNAMIDPNIAWQTSWSIDFGTPTSPLWGGFTQMTEETTYVKTLPLLQAYGVDVAASTAEVKSFQTTTGGAKICDFIYGENGGEYIFKMDLPNGRYKVFCYTGAKDWQNTTHFKFQDGETVYTQVTPLGVASDNYGGPNTYNVDVTDGTLKITIWGEASEAAEYNASTGNGLMSGRVGSFEITKIG